MLSVGQRNDQPKDTLRNIQETSQFVVNIVSENLLAQMNMTSAELPYDVNEFEHAGLTTAVSTVVKPPRVAEADVALECELSQLVPVKDCEYTIVIGKVVALHVRESCLTARGQVDATKLQPMGRLSGDLYTTLGQVVALKRPR